MPLKSNNYKGNLLYKKVGVHRKPCCSDIQAAFIVTDFYVPVNAISFSSLFPFGLMVSNSVDFTKHSYEQEHMIK
jgi:hypothetical protein